MSESDLLKRIAELEAWNLELLTENERLREMLGLPQKNVTAIPQEAEVPEQDNIDEVSTQLTNIVVLMRRSHYFNPYSGVGLMCMPNAAIARNMEAVIISRHVKTNG